MMVSELQHGWLVIALFAVVGACVGSFVNVVCYRYPIIKRLGVANASGQRHEELKQRYGKYNLSVPRSACPCCDSAIHAKHNIPVISWFWLKGKCASCSARISGKYPAIEALFGAVFATYVGFEGLWPAGLISLLIMPVVYCFCQIRTDTGVTTKPLIWIVVALLMTQLVLTAMGYSAYS